MDNWTRGGDNSSRVLVTLAVEGRRRLGRALRGTRCARWIENQNVREGVASAGDGRGGLGRLVGCSLASADAARVGKASAVRGGNEELAVLGEGRPSARRLI